MSKDLALNDSSEDRKLTERQQAFVIEFCEGDGCVGNGVEAARRAGYTETAVWEASRRNLSLPHVKAAIRAAHMRRLDGRLASAALDVLDNIIHNKDLENSIQGRKLQLEAAKTVLDRAGYNAPTGDPEHDGKEKKTPEQMSTAELEEYILKLQERRTRTIDVTPKRSDNSSQDTDN